jgi:hypothetical protein
MTTVKNYGALLQPDGTYAIVGRWFFPSGKTTTTWNIRSKIAMVGGVWNPTKRRWENVSEQFLEQLGASKRRPCLVQLNCCKSLNHPYIKTIYEDEIEASKPDMIIADFCGHCDSRCGTTILEVHPSCVD